MANEEPSSLAELLADLGRRGASESERHREVDRYLDRKARKKGVPLMGSFELTPTCNLDCNMCYVHDHKGQYRPEDLLPVDTWIDYIDQACAAGMMYSQVTGGECLTYPGFNEVFLHLRDRGVNTSVLSNGVLIDESRVDFFVRNEPSIIQISLYGSDDDAYQRVTGHRVFERVKGAIIRLRDAGIRLKLTITVSRPMLPDLSRLSGLLIALNVPYSYTFDLIPPYGDVGRAFDDMRLTTDEILRAHRLIAEGSGITLIGRDLESLPLPQCPAECKIGEGMPCSAGRSSFSINWRGEMLPCTVIDGMILSLLENDFAQAWTRINDWARGHRILRDCEGCAYRWVCHRCPMLHELCAEEGSVDARYCDLIRRSVAEGVIAI